MFSPMSGFFPLLYDRKADLKPNLGQCPFISLQNILGTLKTVSQMHVLLSICEADHGVRHRWSAASKKDALKLLKASRTPDA